MLIDTLEDGKSYTKATLMQCLDEAKTHVDTRIASSYKSILKREKRGVEIYTSVRRDLATNFRLYTGLQIRKIVEYEIERLKGGIRDRVE